MAKITKAQLDKLPLYARKHIKALETAIDEWKVEKPTELERWFGVAYYGWGSWEEDVYFTEAMRPSQAIYNFQKNISDGYWDGHGAEPRDRVLAFGDEERIVVYDIGNGTDYVPVPVETIWKKAVNG